MTLQNVVTFDILSYYDGKIKNWVKALKATAEQDGIMTKEDFSKLAGIASGAQVNVIESVKVDGTALTPDANKAVNIDLSGKAEKSEMSIVAGTGDDADKTTITLKSGTSATVLTTHQNISGKADVVSGATAGNFAGLDASGNLTDSGSKASDFKTKQTAVADPTASGNATAFIDSISQDTNGEITVTKKNIPTVTASVSGQGGNNGLMTAAQAEALAAIDYSGKADKDTDAVEGNFAAFDANGNPVDSGHKHSDYQAAGSYKTT